MIQIIRMEPYSSFHCLGNKIMGDEVKKYQNIRAISRQSDIGNKQE